MNGHVWRSLSVEERVRDLNLRLEDERARLAFLERRDSEFADTVKRLETSVSVAADALAKARSAAASGAQERAAAREIDKHLEATP